MSSHFFRSLAAAGRARFRSRSPAAGPNDGRHARLAFEPLEPRLVLEAGPLLISEFMANNVATRADADGGFSDWIEIYNSSGAAISLKDYCLTDNADDLTQWRFPAVLINPQQYLVVYASGKDRTDPAGELHTNFALDAEGESVALVMPDGLTVAHAYWDFPEQMRDISYGLPDSTTLWEQLVAPGAPVSYHVPTADEDVLAWTAQAYDDSAWTDTITLEATGLVITEMETGETDWLEIQNVSDQAIDTSGWFVVVNDASTGNINDAHGVVWNLPDSVAAGEVLYRTDDPADHYWGSEISWDAGSGWAMIVDDAGQVVDFVAWGYSEAEIASLDVSAGPFGNLSVGDRWQGPGVPGGAGQVPLIDIEHVWSYEQSNTNLGTAWRELGYDDSTWGSGAALLYVEGSGLPAPKNTPLTIGASTYYFRSHFTLDANPASVAQLDLRTVIDDGAVVYINGQEVYRLAINANDQVTHGFYVDRAVGNAFYEGPFTIPTDALVAGDNLIAVEVHQTNSGSSDVVMGLELEATVLEPALARIGNSDVNSSGDFELPAAASKGSQNPGLTVPFVPGTIPAVTGVGFSDDGDFDDLVATDVAEAVQGVNASLWTRVEFLVGDTSQCDVLTLNVQYDDGFIAYLNGVEVARRGAPDPADPLLYDSTATAARPDSQAIVVEEIDISDDLHALRPLETNVLAIHGLNFEATDGDLLILPELIATSNLEGPQYMTSPTPGNDNLQGALGRVADTRFSVDRGFYDAPLNVEIATDTIAAEIRYTLDGSEPTATTGTVYTAPIPIAATTVLRAAAFKTGYISTNLDTQTYFFLDDVLLQSPGGQAPLGWPSGSVNGQVLDYGMDPDIVNVSPWQSQMKDALTSIPSMSVVTGVDNLFGSSIGIYVNANQDGRNWERPASLELIYPPGARGPGFPDGVDEGFQIDMGLRIRGGYSRQDGNPKHAFRFFFRGEYGAGKLDYPLFGDEGADSFDNVDLRTSQNYSWAFGGPNNNTMVREVFSRDVQGEMGQPYTRSRYYHLYINGQYWGIYQTQERSEAGYAASYFGGDPEDYDVVKQNDNREIFATDGNTNAYTRLWQATINGFSNDADYFRAQGMNPDGTRNPAYERLLDVDNLIDYMIITYYTGDRDGPGSRYTTPRPNNYYAAYNRAEPDGWKFFEHDSEHSLGTGENNMVEPLVSLDTRRAELRYFNAHWLHEQLCANDDYVLRFADRVYERFFNDGVLTDQNALAKINARAQQLDSAIIAESARWGDRKTHPPMDRDDWYTDLNEVRNWLQGRTNTVIGQLRAVGWYPTVEPPRLSQHGGRIDPGFGLTMTVVTGGGVYEDTTVVPEFTPARYLVPGDDSLGTTWHYWSFNDASWAAGDTGIGYENNSGYENIINTEVRPHDVVAGATSILVRIPFTVDDLGEVDKLTLRMKYDDGFVAYINGREVERRNITAAPSWNTGGSNHEAGGYVDFDISDHIGELVQGDHNVLAIHVCNTDTGSSDMIVLPQLVVGTLVQDPDGPDIYYTTDGTDPRTVGGGFSGSAVLYDGTPLSIAQSELIKARTHSGGQWSALNEAQFYIHTPASAVNLAITEINYNPYDPTEAELNTQPAGDEDFTASDFEFVELLNTSSNTVIDLTNVQFTEGITFSFNDGTVNYLAPQERVVVVANTDAFSARYGSGVNVAGTFTGKLDNNGETLRLLAADGQDIVNFRYNDAGSWPGRADGKGAALELVDQTGTDAADYENGAAWRSSSRYGGTPGAVPAADLGVVITEVLTHTDYPQVDTVELHNPTGSLIDVGGWYLSDEWGWESSQLNGDYKKFRIPDGTTIPAGGYLAFYEGHYDQVGVLRFGESEFGGPGAKDFALDGARGDDVWLMEADTAGNLTRFVDHVEFGAAANGESFGRWPTAADPMVPMAEVTLGGENTGSRVGPVVISEIMYNPVPDVGGEEFVELYNASHNTVRLYDPDYPSNTWKIAGLDFTFPGDVQLPPGGVMLVVPSDPVAFRAQYGVPADVQIFGPYAGALDNAGETLRLLRPDGPTADDPPVIPWLLVDEVDYAPDGLWPSEADG
ncbi:MAG TPA: lamin tail domain-containing protein, partial [Thermoguttaceae bacterium]|nr:lamin tail domain-containing protein [Thermoguttaceae bacterium]